MDSIYLIVNEQTGEIKARVMSLKKAFELAIGNLTIREVPYG